MYGKPPQGQYFMCIYLAKFVEIHCLSKILGRKKFEIDNIYENEDIFKQYE